MAIQAPRKRKITKIVVLVAALFAVLPWVSGQLVAWKVHRQITALDQHPAFTVIESNWQAGYANSTGHIVLAERIGCGVRACSETPVYFTATHINFWPLGWGSVVATADLNGVLQHELNPPVSPLVIHAAVGVFGQSRLEVHMAPSWHELGAKRADAIAFSGFDAEFIAKNYASSWVGELTASFTVLTEEASAIQRERLSRMMQSLGVQPSGQPENIGIVIVRVVSLMKELSSAIMLWHGKERVWQPEIKATPIDERDRYLVKKAPASQPLRLELTPDILVSTQPQASRKIALELPSFECWHGDNPMPAITSKLDQATKEEEPEFDLWQLKLSWSGDSVKLNGLALWQK